MNNARHTILCKQKANYSIDEVSDMFGVNVWTIRFWIDKFKVIKPRRDKNGNLLFVSDDLDKIRLIYRLSQTKGIKRTDVQRHLAAGGDI